MQKLFLKIHVKGSNFFKKKKQRRMRLGVVGLVTQAECLTYKERAPTRAFIFYLKLM